MQEIDLKIFGMKLKKIAQEKYGGVGILGEKMGMTNLSAYTSGTREPGLRIIYKLYQAGIDINELLGDEDKLEESKKMVEMELQKTEKLENEVNKLKVMLFDMSEEKKEQVKKNEVLLSQIVVLDQATRMKRSSSA